MRMSDCLKGRFYLFAFLLPSGFFQTQLVSQVPEEPIRIKPGVPQFVFDSHLVDNHWAIRYKRQAVTRVFHSPVRHSDNPLSGFAGQKPSYCWVVKDGEADSGKTVFRMYYQANFQVKSDSEKGRKYRTDTCYAESLDGVNWRLPDLNIFPEKSLWAKPNNVVIGFPDRQKLETSAPSLLENVPEKDRRGYRYIVTYRSKGKGGGDVSGIRLVGSKDGIHFDFENDTRIAHLHSDHHNTLCYDSFQKRYRLFCRAKQIYRAFGSEMIDTGASRRVAVMESPKLWTDWMEGDKPRTLLVPDEQDSALHYNFFYGMPTVRRHGIYWGFLEPFRMNDFIHTEVTTSRDGTNWLRLPGRPKWIDYGQEDSWDDTMIFGSPAWVEVGDEWWFYYAGWDGPHGTSERNGSIGLATCKRERVMSLRGPSGGGVVATRTLLWPGGDLWLNLEAVPDAKQPKVTVRISGPNRKLFEGFDHGQSEVQFQKSNTTRALVHWNAGKQLSELSDQPIRIEVFLKEMDLFSFGTEK